MSLSRRHFFGALLLVTAACAKRETVGAPTYLTSSAQGMATIPSLPMLLVETAARSPSLPSAKRGDIDRVATRIRAVMAPIEHERRAFLGVLADGVSANAIDRKSCDLAIEKISAAADKAAPDLRDAVRELHRLLGKSDRAMTVDAVARSLGTVDDEDTYVHDQELRAMAAELELHQGKRWSVIRQGNEAPRRYRSPLTEPTHLRKALTTFEDSDAEEAGWLVVREAVDESTAWARRMVALVEVMLVDLDDKERRRLADRLRSSRDMQ